MNNMELTRAVHELQTSMRDVAQRLAAAIPKIEQDVSDSASDIKMMFESLKQEFKLFIDQIAPTIDTVTNMQAQLTAEQTRLKEAEVMVIKLVGENKLRDQQIKKFENIMTDQAQNMGVD